MPQIARVSRRQLRAASQDAPTGHADPQFVTALLAELEAKAAVIREQSEHLAHFRKLFDSASAAARIGVWQCELPSNALTWTDVVYDLFDLPRGIRVDRQMILALYPEHSRRQLERVRQAAIEAGSGFQLDVEIRTARGALRWIRITATVESENGRPVRIFGMKQDITEERRLADRLRALAEQDPMTGLSNRGRFQAELDRFDAGAEDPLSEGTLMIVDLDGFKAINDTLGHEVGDAVIRESAGVLAAVCSDALVVARIGGDEFAAILPTGDEDAASAMAERLVEAFGRVGGTMGLRLATGASIGIARAGRRTSEALFRAADGALYEAKAAGRGTFRTAAPTP